MKRFLFKHLASYLGSRMRIPLSLPFDHSVPAVVSVSMDIFLTVTLLWRMLFRQFSLTGVLL